MAAPLRRDDLEQVAHGRRVDRLQKIRLRFGQHQRSPNFALFYHAASSGGTFGPGGTRRAHRKVTTSVMIASMPITIATQAGHWP